MKKNGNGNQTRDDSARISKCFTITEQINFVRTNFILQFNAPRLREEHRNTILGCVATVFRQRNVHCYNQQPFTSTCFSFDERFMEFSTGLHVLHFIFRVINETWCPKRDYQLPCKHFEGTKRIAGMDEISLIRKT